MATAARSPDGSAGDSDYGLIGSSYSRYRQPDPRIAARIHAALAEARTVLNVGAGAGSYEPLDRDVTAVEPSAAMRSQRPGNLPAALDATADDLPFADAAFDAAMTTFSVHQWSDPSAGLREMRRVTRGPVVILTCDPDLVQEFWLADYAPDVLEVEARRYPSIDELGRHLGGTFDREVVPIPLDCVDGFNEAYYGRPERLFDDAARLSCSAWSFVDADTQARYVDHLRSDVGDGTWDRRYGFLRAQPTFTGSLVLVTAQP